jgi:hypothetical protein
MWDAPAGAVLLRQGAVMAILTLAARPLLQAIDTGDTAWLLAASAFLVSGAIAWVVHRTMGFRIDEEHELTGIDLVIHAETAYDVHSTAGGRSSGGLLVSKATAGPFATGNAQRSTNQARTERLET